jgi:hypothetical protein
MPRYIFKFEQRRGSPLITKENFFQINQNLFFYFCLEILKKMFGTPG